MVGEIQKAYGFIFLVRTKNEQVFYLTSPHGQKDNVMNITEMEF